MAHTTKSIYWDLTGRGKVTPGASASDDNASSKEATIATKV